MKPFRLFLLRQQWHEGAVSIVTVGQDATITITIFCAIRSIAFNATVDQVVDKR